MVFDTNMLSKYRLSKCIQIALLIFPFTFFFYLTTFSQQYNLHNYSNEEGLPQSQVFDILQDNKGYLWVATNGGGAARFDGKNFFILNTDNGLADNRVSSLIQDKKGNIWFATQNGVSKYDGEKVTNYGEKQGLKALKALSICEDLKGNIWVGSDQEGLYKFNGEKFSLVKIPNFENSDKYSRIIIHKMMCDKTGSVWVGTSVGLFCFKGNNIREYSSRTTNICSNDIWSLEEDHHQNIWIGTWNSDLCHFNRKVFTPIGENYGVSNKMVTTIFEDDQQNIWIGTDGGGVFKMNNHNSVLEKISLTIEEKNGLPSNRVRSIFQDREGNIWIGTDGGLSRFDGGMFTSYTIKDGLNNKFVFSLIEDKYKNIYIGTESGINIFDGTTISEYQPAGIAFHKHVWTQLIDQKNTYHVGTYLGGLYSFDGTKIKNYTSEKGLTNNVIFDLQEDNNGTKWIATDYGIGVFYKDKLYNFRSGVNCTSTNFRIRSICSDSKKNVWFGTRSGLIKYTPSGKYPKTSDFKKIHLNKKIDSGILLSVVEDGNGYIWFGNYGVGLVRLNPSDNSFIILTTKDGLCDNGILSLVCDGKYLWIGTVNGINRFEYQEFNSSGKKIFRHFGKAEGVKGVEVNQNAILRDGYGNIWFGTGEGAIKYDPHFDRINKIEPATHITNVKLFFEDIDWKKYSKTDNKQTDLLQSSILPYNKNHLTFYFSGISLTVPEKVRYQYKLQGLDDRWSPITSETYASYPGLPPGDYTFLVKAMNNEGIWNSKPAKFSFTINPPYWKTIWFLSLCIFLGIILLFSIIMIRTRGLRIAKKRLEEEVMNRTKELHEKNTILGEKSEIIEQKNKDITDSINYARRIQSAILADEQSFQAIFSNSFVLFHPKDIVSGDFYWISKKKDNILFTAGDCTGHGVPGAFMSLIGISRFNEVVNEKNIIEPKEILHEVRNGIITALKQRDEFAEQKDGMDAAFCCYNQKTRILKFAGANNPLWLIRAANKVEIEVLRATKQPIGIYGLDDSPFIQYETQLETGDTFYVFSDGYADQFGGPDGKKFMSSRFKNLLLSIQHLSMEEQKQKLFDAFHEWKGQAEQLDDILVIGIRI